MKTWQPLPATVCLDVNIVKSVCLLGEIDMEVMDSPLDRVSDLYTYIYLFILLYKMLWQPVVT